MNLPISRCFALLVAGACVVGACGGKAVIDGRDGSTATGMGGSTTTSSSGAGGCAPALHTIDAGDFDASCMVDSNCLSVFIGDLCGNCRCPNASINAAGKAKYDAEVKAKSAPPSPGGCFCPAIKSKCAQGHCAPQ